jgi:hypothetical protein
MKDNIASTGRIIESKIKIENGECNGVECKVSCNYPKRTITCFLKTPLNVIYLPNQNLLVSICQIGDTYYCEPLPCTEQYQRFPTAELQSLKTGEKLEFINGSLVKYTQEGTSFTKQVQSTKILYGEHNVEENIKNIITIFNDHKHTAPPLGGQTTPPEPPPLEEK